LILPNIPEAIKKLFAASIISQSNDANLINFVFNPEFYFGQRTRVSYVGKGNENPQESLFINDLPQGIISDYVTYYPIQTSDKSGEKNKLWGVKFWVDRDVYQRLNGNDDTSILAGLGVNGSINAKNIQKILEFSVEDFSDDNKKRKIKNIYQKISNSEKEKLNKTSMLMATFIDKINFSANEKCSYKQAMRYYDLVKKPGFVCTGDYPINSIKKSTEIMSHYWQQQHLLYEMMAPHHGGDSYCDYMPFGYMKCVYAQNSWDNPYGHPGIITKNNLKQWGINFINLRIDQNNHED
jgi:hypothetical protein